ncbi:hypothetical protein D9M71_335180 [compost metagenome]
MADSNAVSSYPSPQRKIEMPHSLHSQLLACTGAIRTAAARVQPLAAAAGYFFYGYWFSHRRA